MTTHDYRYCSRCGKEFQIAWRMADTWFVEPAYCPTCEHAVKHCPVCGEQLRMCCKCGHYKLCSFSFRVDHERCRCPKVYDFSRPRLFPTTHEQKP